MNRRVETTRETKYLDLSSIRLLDIDLNRFSLKIEKTDIPEAKIIVPKVVHEKDRQFLEIQIEQTPDKLRIMEKGEKRIGGFFSRGLNVFGETSVILSLPLSCTVSEAEIHLSMGSAKLLDFDLEALDLELNMGSGTLQNMKIDDAQLMLSMGSLTLRDSSFSDAKMKLSMGSIKGSARFEGSASMQCSMGSLSLKLNQPSSAFGYDIHCNMGSIKVGGQKMESPVRQPAAARQAYLEIDVNMGSVQLDFEP